jgi:hypothetical protein
MDVEQRVALLEKAMEQVRQLSPHYDDVLREVCVRIDTSGSVGKGDIGTLAFWKRIRTDSWSESFLSWSEARVREVTAAAVVAAREPGLIAAASNARELLRNSQASRGVQRCRRQSSPRSGLAVLLFTTETRTKDSNVSDWI